MKSSYVLKIRVQPMASKNQVDGCGFNALRLKVTAKPENGKTNTAVIGLLAAALSVNKSRLTVIKGLKSRDKSVVVESLTLEEAERKLKSALG